MSDWEAKSDAHLASLLVGDHFGDRPEEKLDDIRAAKRQRADYLCRRMGCTKSSVVLEIGSGMGFTSKHIAPRVERLYCSDISDSFLRMARQECADVPNVEFLQIEEEPATFPFEDGFFDIIFADAVFIHLNLYDIYWYFAEFQRLAKKRGTVFVNTMNGSSIDPKKLADMAGYYRKNSASLKRLLCWNSLDAVVTVAAQFGFTLQPRSRLWRVALRPSPTIDLLFTRR